LETLLNKTSRPVLPGIRLRAAGLLAAIVAALALAACGGGDSESPTATAAAPTPTQDIESSMPGMDHGDGMVDGDAPVFEVEAFDLRFEPEELMVSAGEPFTIRLHNNGGLEHDFTIEGFEDMGGAHAMAGMAAMSTFEMEMPGEYTGYCSVPGHRQAGMEVRIVAG
jgi:uncharacterized cupredoxin-like copper-binding protein